MRSKSAIVLMVRHGRTALNEAKPPRLRAWEDVPLSKHGVLDAKLAGAQLKRFKPQALWSSDFERDIATAHIIGGILDNLPQEVDYALRTANVGELSGKTEEEALPFVENWYRNPWIKAPSGESLNEFLARFYPAFDLKYKLAKTSLAYCPTVMVTHGRPIAAMYARILRVPQWEARMPMPGGIMAVGEDEVGNMACEFLSDTEPILEDR